MTKQVAPDSSVDDGIREREESRYKKIFKVTQGFLMSQWVKNPPAMQETQETWIQLLGGEDTLEGEMATTPVLLPTKSHGQRSLAGYSPWGHKESDTTE